MVRALFFSFLAAFLLGGCGLKEPSAHNFDRLSLSQNPNEYVTSGAEIKFDDVFLRKKIFEVWDENFNAESALPYAEQLLKKEGFKENLQRYTQEERAKLLANAQKAKSVNKNGITLRNSDIRLLPTKKPYFFDHKKVGEGYPFDYFQESRIYANTPVKVLFESGDGAFFYVANYVQNGWMDSRDLLFLEQKESDFLKNSAIYAVIKDKTALFDENDAFVEKMQLGSFLFEHNSSFYAAGKKLKTDGSVASKLPIPFTQEGFATLVNAIMEEPYGWGGLLDDRDCSMFLRDLFLPFGLYLPRNSKDQALFDKQGYTDLFGMSEASKKEFLRQNAKPFLTLLYLRGHIMLFLGFRDSEPIAMHDAWGFGYEKNGEERRFVIGKPIVSTLFVGEKHDGFTKSKSLMNRLQGIRTLR